MPKYIKGLYFKDEFFKLDLPQILFFGRSNVGKSSLINKILKTNLAKTSQIPGKTQAIHIYENVSYYLVDLPGYGFSKVSKQINNNFSNLIEDYLNYIKDENYFVLLLIDFKVGLQKTDYLAIKYLIDNDTNFSFVLTKMDKTNQSERAKTLKILDQYNHKIYQVSSLKNKGIDTLTKELSNMTDFH